MVLTGADKRPRTGPAELAADIRQRNRGLVRDLRLEVAESGVILHGSAYSFYGKQVAQHEVRRLTGLTVLANRMTVAGQG